MPDVASGKFARALNQRQHDVHIPVQVGVEPEHAKRAVLPFDVLRQADQDAGGQPEWNGLPNLPTCDADVRGDKVVQRW